MKRNGWIIWAGLGALMTLLYIGFGNTTVAAEQIARINVSDLAAQIVTLQEANDDLTARVAALEATVAELVAGTTADAAVAESTDEPPSDPQPSDTDAESTDAEPTETEPVDLETLDPEIDWGPLEDYFDISDIRFEEQQVTDPLGRLMDANVLAFTVEAHTAAQALVFFARFYDTEEIEVDILSPVEFDPNYSATGWEVGGRSRAYVVLPREIADVTVIRFSQL